MDKAKKDAQLNKKSFPEGRGAWTENERERGKIVIPQQARQIFDIKPGDTLIVLSDENRGIAIPLKEQFGKLMATIFDKAG